jgi:hypothetical protein
MRNRKKRAPLPPVARVNGRDARYEVRSEVREHVQARARMVERIAIQGLTVGLSFKQLVQQLMAAPKLDANGTNVGGAGANREEAEDALRRAEEEIRLDMSANNLRDMAMSYRRLKNAARKVALMLEAQQEPGAVSRLAHTLKELEERMAVMRGWDEPERMHVIVSNPSEQARKVFEGLDDDALLQLAVEEELRRERDRRAREILGLPPDHQLLGPSAKNGKS